MDHGGVGLAFGSGNPARRSSVFEHRRKCCDDGVDGFVNVKGRHESVWSASSRFLSSIDTTFSLSRSCGNERLFNKTTSAPFTGQ